MRLQITPQVLKDIARIKTKLQKAARDIKADTPNKVQEVGTLGFNFAYNLAPHYRGHLKAAMRLEFPDMNAFMIISAASPQDRGFHVGIPFDTGMFGGMTMWGPGGIRVPFVPRRGVGFMRQTAVFLQQEFAQRLGLAIHHSIERIGKGNVR